MQSLGSAASVIAAIREDAAAEADRIDEAARLQITAIRAEGISAGVAIPDRDLRIARARAESDERIARQEWEGRRQAIEQREAWIQRIVTESERRGRTSAAQLQALIHEALARIEAAECEIVVAQQDLPLVDPKQLGRDVRVIAGPISGGCIVSAGDLAFDNSLEARALRLEPEWRSALSEVYRP